MADTKLKATWFALGAGSLALLSLAFLNREPGCKCRGRCEC